MKTITELKPSVKKVAEKMKKVYADALAHKIGNVTFRALPESDIRQYIDLSIYRYDESDLDVYVDNLLFGYETMMEARREVEDNYIPQLNVNLGIGDYSAFVAGDIYFDKDTSWSMPSLADLDSWKDIAPIGTSVWYKKYMYILERILKKTENTDIPFSRGFYSPMDLAGALRGTDIYTDFYDEPDKLHDFLDFCADATISFAKDIYAMIRKYRKNATYGTMYIDGMVNMSEDLSSNLSPELYREFCAPHTQKVIDAFGSGHMHCHSCAMYLVKEICSLKNVANLWLATDPNQPRPFDHLEKLVEDSYGVCMAIDCDSFDEIKKNIGVLRKGNFSVCLPCTTVDEAKILTEKFRRL